MAHYGQFNCTYGYPYASTQQQQQQQHQYQQQQFQQPYQQQQQQNANLPPSVYQAWQQSRQRQAMGIAAAASISSVLNPNKPDPRPHRTIVAYDDISPSSVNMDPQSASLYCCNRWYKTLEAVSQHRQQHVSCSDCSFEGVKVVVDQHAEAQHGKVLLKKSKKPDGIVPPNAPKLDTPEALAAWIEARKRNWPSDSNITRKKEEEDEQAKLREKRKRRDNDTPAEPSKKTKENTALGAIVDYTSDSEEEYHSAKEDNDTVNPERDAISSKDPTSMGKILLPEEHKTRPRRICRYFMRGNCKRGSECTFSHEKPAQSPAKSAQREPTRRRPNLLRMMLDKEIRREQSIIFQCFQYLIDKDMC